MASKLLLTIAVVALLGVFAPYANGATTTCSCWLRWTCMGPEGTGQYDMMGDEFDVKVNGIRHLRNPLPYCQSRCLNRLKAVLGSDFDTTTRMKPNMVLVDNLIAQHRVCQLVSRTDNNCAFSYQYGATGLSRQSMNLGSIGCAVITQGTAPAIGTFKFPVTVGTTTLASPTGSAVMYTTVTTALTTAALT